MGTRAAILLAIAVTVLPWRDAQAQPRPRTVLVVHWGTEEFPATAVVNAAIGRALAASDLPIDYFSEYLESDVFGREQGSAALADYIRRKYRGRRIDLVIAIADPALEFVVDYRDKLFPDAPIVYSGVGIPPGIRRGVGNVITGVLRDVAYTETLELALGLHPLTERVFVVARLQDGQTEDSVRAALSGFSPRVALTYIDEDSVPALIAAVREVPPRSLILYIWHRNDGPRSAMSADAVAGLVAQASAVPVYGTNEVYVGSGVVGGVARVREETATRVGEMAGQILQGTRPRDIPIEHARLLPIFDWRQVQRWGIDPSRLPQESIIRFKVPTAWETYHWQIIAALLLSAAELLLIAGLLVHRARHRRAESVVRRREATIRASYVRIRQLAGRLIHAQEVARAAIARDLHDDVCQELAGALIAVGKLKRSGGDIQAPRAQRTLSMLQDRTSSVLEGIRRLSHELHPSSLQFLGLVPALEAHCVEVEKRHDVQVGFRAEGDVEHLQPDLAVCLFRITQEALRNAAVHGKARRMNVSITRSGDAIELIVMDDGRGFDVEAVRRDSRGLGLVSIEERAHVAGAEVKISSRPQQGTTIQVRLTVVAVENVKNEEIQAPVVAAYPETSAAGRS